ncbi:MAG: hypothetical protein H6R27_1574 [Proteobacteria bacterium]|nr:hypothetical protein [Pseudomonadota bacterium]
MTATPRLRLPVAVVMSRRTVSRSGWSVASWQAVGVVAGEKVPGAETRGSTVYQGDAEEHFLWGGLHLELYRDATEAYWGNLVGQQPALYVICTEAEDGTMVPESVTADANEASAGVEGNDRVFSVPIPPEVYPLIERFVVEHHRPQEKHKRKRAEWSADDPR